MRSTEHDPSTGRGEPAEEAAALDGQYAPASGLSTDEAVRCVETSLSALRVRRERAATAARASGGISSVIERSTGGNEAPALSGHSIMQIASSRKYSRNPLLPILLDPEPIKSK
jgi:hypothetical protein